MKNFDHIELTSADISTLWTAYQSDTLAICGLKFFLTHVEDEEIESLLADALVQTEQQVEALTNFFNKGGYPVPKGFSGQDVDLSAPRLFSDKLYLEYILNMTIFTLTTYSMSLSVAERKDVIDYFSESLKTANDLHKKSKELAKEKGVYIRTPQIPKPKQVDFVKKQSFLAGWFADKRPLIGVEITNLVFNAKRNALGQAIITGFSQVAKSKEVRSFFEKGQDISGKHVEVFASILHAENLHNGALLMTSEVTDSTVSPFSDKFMMTLVTMLIASGIGQYGVSMAASPRHDIGAHYTRLIAETAKYSNEGANILIDNGWMEQPPMAADRKELAK
ncbi:DUF3231 family protein [Virgibacillus sp. C22-A2]|uniref:DUF3231 family protein n=1 Tax=Virgibacillus tibetensis TaxID=3042313 RepID=A0ABU6KKM7_9BACI|nr:DUF3231 family protein [Virgibacillus sp. C22-A2]